MTIKASAIEHQGSTFAPTTSLPGSSTPFQVDDRPAGVTFVALMEILLSLYFFAGTRGILIALTMHPKSLQQYDFVWLLGSIALCVTSVLLLIAGLFLFRKCEWARRATMLLAAINALCSVLLHCHIFAFSGGHLFNFFLSVVVLLTIGILPTIILTWPGIKENFQAQPMS